MVRRAATWLQDSQSWSFTRFNRWKQMSYVYEKHRRLTKLMKRELVKSLRTVVLLAMFSQDSTTVANIQSCLKSMCTMEPDLILHPILERAVPSLEALVEVSRVKGFENNYKRILITSASADSTHHRSYQGPWRCCTCYCLAWRLLSWSQAPRPYLAAADSRHWSG